MEKLQHYDPIPIIIFGVPLHSTRSVRDIGCWGRDALARLLRLCLHGGQSGYAHVSREAGFGLPFLKSPATIG